MIRTVPTRASSLIKEEIYIALDAALNEVSVANLCNICGAPMNTIERKNRCRLRAWRPTVQRILHSIGS